MWRQRGLQLHSVLSHVNDALLIPMFTIMVLETGTGRSWRASEVYLLPNLGFCTIFLLEWLLGLAVAVDRRRYLTSPGRVVDLLSSIPFGHLFQGLRLLRLARLLRVVRLITRVRRYRRRLPKALRGLTIVAAIVLAGAFALRIVEPSAVDSFGAAIWWSVVTVSTVGYGDIAPQTPAGRLVAGVLIFTGVGLFGFVAGFVANLMDAPEDEDVAARLERIEAKLDVLGVVQSAAEGSPAERPEHLALASGGGGR